MAGRENFQTMSTRRKHNYNRSFDVVLAAAFEPDVELGCRERFDFYDAVGEVIAKVGKKPFLPHREIDLNWPPGKIYDIVNEIVVPTSDLVVGYLGVPSIAAGMIVGKALGSGVPVSYLYEEHVGLGGLDCNMIEINGKPGRMKEKVSQPGFRGDIRDLIEFRTDEEALVKLETSLRAFYK